MSLTQMQIIQSLEEAMSWLEREIGRGANPAELRTSWDVSMNCS